VFRQVFNINNLKFLVIIFWMSSSACLLYFFDKEIEFSVSLRVLIISLLFAISFFIVFIFSPVKTRVFRILLSLFVIIPSLLVVSGFSVTGAIMNRGDFRVFFTTDQAESMEFIEQFLDFKTVALVLGYILPLFVLLIIKPVKPVIGRAVKNSVIALTIILLAIVCLTNWSLVSKNYHVVGFYRSYYNFKQAQKFDKLEAARQNIKFEGAVVSELKIKNPKTFVVIIGESQSRSHMQLYGYERETNPKLSAIKDHLYVFKNVTSPATTTVEVMKHVLTLANQRHPEFFLQKRSIVNLFNEAGYDTVWIGNQGFKGNKYNISHGVIANECAKSYEIAYKHDQAVVDALGMTLRIRGNRDRIVFIHLRGSHTKYTERYTKDFAYFDHNKIPLPYGSNLSEDKKQIIDEYDNSVRFNDHIISSIIDIVRAQSEYSWVLYFSDHGEEMFEYRDMFGHQAKNFSRYMCEIPYILWVSDKYKAANSNFFANMKYYLERPYSTEDVIHSISALSKLRYADFEKSRSIFSADFKELPRLVNGKPYGEVQPVHYATEKKENHEEQ